MTPQENDLRLLESAADQLARALDAVQARHPCNCRDGYDRHAACQALQDYAEVRDQISLAHSA